MQESLDRRPARLVAVAAAVGIGGYLLVVLWGLVLLGLFGPTSGILETQILNGAALALGALLTTRVYLRWMGLEWSFLDLDPPSLRDLGWATLGLLALVAVSYLVGVLQIPTAEHGVTDAVRSAGVESLWVLVPVSILLVGPAEELVYRNLVQKTLAQGLETGLAIVGASVIFAVAHLPAYASPDALATAGSLTAVFVLSLILGAVYARTRNLAAVALVHGAYDAIAFADVFLGTV